MTELTLERLAELELAIGSEYDGELHLHETTARELLAAARRLAELEGALEFISCFHGFQVLNESCPGEPMYAASIDDHMGQTRATPGEAVVALAKEAGWPGIESGKHLEQSE